MVAAVVVVAALPHPYPPHSGPICLAATIRYTHKPSSNHVAVVVVVVVVAAVVVVVVLVVVVTFTYAPKPSPTKKSSCAALVVKYEEPCPILQPIILL